MSEPVVVLLEEAVLVVASVVNTPVDGVVAPMVVLLIVALTMGTAPTHEEPSHLHV